MSFIIKEEDLTMTAGRYITLFGLVFLLQLLVIDTCAADSSINIESIDKYRATNDWMTNMM